LPVIGYLGARSASSDANYVDGFREGLAENGLIAGRDVGIEFRWSDGQFDRLPALAAELVRLGVSLIVAAGGSAVPAAKAATSTIPIVFSTGGDPVNLGLVASLSRPGGNLTGVTTLARDLVTKQLELLRDIVPNVDNFAFITDRAEQDTETQITLLQQAARKFQPDILVLSPHNDSEIEAAFSTMMQRGTGGIVVGNSAVINAYRGLVVALAVRHGIPVVYQFREWVAVGGLMSYGTSFRDNYRQVGIYAGRILKGAKPADMPVLQPSRFELVINLGTAKALGLTIPETLLATADEVIQ
jgi:putative ABC transport system substrate-binding protein